MGNWAGKWDGTLEDGRSTADNKHWGLCITYIFACLLLFILCLSLLMAVSIRQMDWEFFSRNVFALT